jgi:hypothetical protein
MAAATAAPRRRRRAELSDDELREVLALSKDVDSVELKLTLPDANQNATVRALGVDPLDAQIRMVSFFDTPDLALNKAGVVVRARRVQGREDDSVVKLRPVVPAEMSDRMRAAPGMVVELDAMPGGYVCSASMKARLGTKDVRRVVRGKREISSLYSKRQRKFYAANAPEGLALDDLRLLGPIFVLKLNHTPSELARKLALEMWFYPDGSRILELSTRCAAPEMFQVATEVRAFLAGRDIDATGEQQTKTKTALEFFAKHLQP